MLAVACLAAFSAWAESNAATPNPDRGASVSEPPRPGSPVPDEAAQARVAAAYGKLPISFEANQGQTDARVDFLSRGSNYSLFLTSTAAVAVLRKGTSGGSSVLRMELVGANPRPPVEGQEPRSGRSNYFIGNDPAQWRADIPTFGRVKYGNVWPGIDLAYHGNQRQLEYDFIVAPHANPSAIKLGVSGARKLRVDRHSDLVLQLSGGELRTHRPVAYQEADGVKSIVDAGYVIRGKNKVGIRLAAYDRSRAVVIDPTVVYSTFLGGSAPEFGYGIAVDATGNAYVTGTTSSTNLPTTAGAFQTSFAGGTYDAFVTKLNPAGSALLYSTYLGGSGDDTPAGIAVDATGNAYVTGYTLSTNFPTTAGAFQTTKASGYDTFATKLNAAGSALVYSTYLGGSGNDQAQGIAVDAAGDAYVTGYTNSTTFPTTAGAFQTTKPGFNGSGYSAFVTELNPAGSALVYSTYLGEHTGAFGDDSLAHGIAIDAAGAAYVTGETGTKDFATTAGAFQTSFLGQRDAFVTKLNPTGSALSYSTYLGGTLPNTAAAYGYSAAVDAAGNAYVTGFTNSSNFPTTTGVFRTTFPGGSAVFVTKLNPTGSALSYSTYIGVGQGNGIAVDAAGNAFVTGLTQSTIFPITAGAFQTTLMGTQDAFVTELNASGSGLLYSTYLGGGGNDWGQAIAVDAGGNAYVAGYTRSTDFPTTAAAFQTTLGGVQDAFVTRFALKPTILCCGDFNGDKMADILWRNTADGTVAIWLMNADGTIKQSVGGQVIPSSWAIVGIGDFNGDGIADILWRNTSDGTVAIWLMNADGSIKQSVGFQVVPNGWTIAGTGNFNVDTISDILWRCTDLTSTVCTDGTVAIWLMNPDGTIKQSVGGQVVPLNWTIAGTDDFNADGIADILWRNMSDGTVAIWLMNADGTIKQSVGGQVVPSSWTIVRIGDFNGDGIADILWRNTSDGTVAIWLMNADGTINQSVGGQVVPLNWTIAGTGDFNGDKKADILWRNTADGTVAIWLMNGGQILSAVGGQIVPNNWQIE